MMTAFMIALVVLSNSAGDVCITRGMKQVGEVSSVNPIEILRIAGRMLSNVWFLLGVFFLAVSYFSFLTVLTWADLSFVVPATAVVYVVNLFAAKFFLREEISPMRWAGTILVGFGVALVCLP